MEDRRGGRWAALGSLGERERRRPGEDGADGRGSDGATAGPPGPWFISGKDPASPTRAGLGQQNTGWMPALSHPLTTSLCAADNLHDLTCQPQKREAQGMVGGGVGGGEGMAVLKLPLRFPTWSSNWVD